jgi:hypothetical protein
VPNHKLVDLEPPDSSATDCQLTNSERTNGQCTNRDGGESQHANCFCPDAYCREMNGPSSAFGSIVMGGACTTFTRRHRLALDCEVDSGEILRALTFELSGAPPPTSSNKKTRTGAARTRG